MLVLVVLFTIIFAAVAVTAVVRWQEGSPIILLLSFVFIVMLWWGYWQDSQVIFTKKFHDKPTPSQIELLYSQCGGDFYVEYHGGKAAVRGWYVICHK